MPENLVDMFLNEIKSIDGMSSVIEGDRIIIIPPKIKYYYMPRIVIKDRERLETALQEYIYTIINTDIKYTKIDEKHNIAYFLGILIKNLTNEDCLNFCEFVETFTQFIVDDTFESFSEKTALGSLDQDYAITIKRSEEYYGLETPYMLKLWKCNRHIEYELPVVRYGVYKNTNGERVARLYAVQQKKSYKETKSVDEVRKSLSLLNSGVKDFRDVSPSMVASLTIFIGLLHREGIRKLEVIDYIPRRYMHFRNVNSLEERDRIQFHATDKFLRLILRVQSQLDGVEVTSYPNDVDSYMHITLDENINSKSKNLEPYLSLGLGSNKTIDRSI